MAGNGIIEVNDANFDQDVLKSDTPVLVDFWATWCGPCRAIAPIVEELAKEYQGKVKIGKMDVDSNSATPMRYGVRGIPTLLVFKGGQVKEQIVGYVPKETIQKALDKHWHKKHSAISYQQKARDSSLGFLSFVAFSSALECTAMRRSSLIFSFHMQFVHTLWRLSVSKFKQVQANCRAGQFLKF